MAKIFSCILPFLCKSSRVRRSAPAFYVHSDHSRVSDLKYICFYFFIFIQIIVWFCHFLVLKH